MTYVPLKISCTVPLNGEVADFEMNLKNLESIRGFTDTETLLKNKVEDQNNIVTNIILDYSL